MQTLAKPTGIVDRLALFGAQELIVFVLLAGLLAAWKDGGPAHVLTLLTGVLCAWGITLGLQFLVRRKRPFQDGVKPLMHMLVVTPSFPSAHAAISFAIAGSFLRGWEAVMNPFVPATFIIYASIVAWSRVRVGVHYGTDVLAGAVIGLGIGGLVAHMVLTRLVM